MANKEYLDSEGLKQLVDYINRLHKSQDNAIDILNGSNETPGSVKKMIKDAIEMTDIADLQQGEPICFYGGSASEVMEASE